MKKSFEHPLTTLVLILNNLKKFKCSCCKRTSPDRVKPDELAEYDSRWADRDEFKKILITNRIIMDHFPDTVDNALKYFSNSSGPYLGTASSRSSTAAFIS